MRAHSRDAQLLVAIEGWTESFQALADSCEETPGVVIDPGTQQVLAPVPDTNGTLLAGVQYTPHGMQYKVYSTAKDTVRFARLA